MTRDEMIARVKARADLPVSTRKFIIIEERRDGKFIYSNVQMEHVAKSFTCLDVLSRESDIKVVDTEVDDFSSILATIIEEDTLRLFYVDFESAIDYLHLTMHDGHFLEHYLLEKHEDYLWIVDEMEELIHFSEIPVAIKEDYTEYIKKAYLCESLNDFNDFNDYDAAFAYRYADYLVNTVQDCSSFAEPLPIIINNAKDAKPLE